MRAILSTALFLATAIAIGCGAAATATKTDVDIASLAPATTEQPNPGALQTAVFGGGCFWGVEAVYEHVKGVTDSRSGYAGGDAKSAKYDLVSDGKTGHAEVVQVTYDPSKVAYSQLLAVFFSVVHDPTQLNYQGPDHGPQYRSAIFYTTEKQKRLAAEYIDSLTNAKAFPKPIVTEVTPLKRFFEAEGYHQDYLVKNPDQPYIVKHDKPKLEALKRQFPDLWVE